jgi:hypothetical protein
VRSILEHSCKDLIPKKAVHPGSGEKRRHMGRALGRCI